jgi:hypothetical protein
MTWAMEKQSFWRKSLFLYHVQHRPQIDWPGIKIGPPWLEASDLNYLILDTASLRKWFIMYGVIFIICVSAVCG